MRSFFPQFGSDNGSSRVPETTTTDIGEPLLDEVLLRRLAMGLFVLAGAAAGSPLGPNGVVLGVIGGVVVGGLMAFALGAGD